MRERCSLLIIFFLLLCSCNYTTQHPQKVDNKKGQNSLTPISPLDNKKLINELVDNALLRGDTNAYNKVASYFIIENMGREFLYNAIIMANKYNCAEAYFHVYFILSYPNSGERFNDLDNKTKKIALYYLLKAYELKYKSAIYEVDELFKDSIPKSQDVITWQ